MQWKNGFIIEVASLEGVNLVVHVFYYHNASEIWPYERGVLTREGLLSYTFVH